MQGFGMGRYRPPDSDPRKEPFNTTSHPLGKRARLLDSHGILIVRFELPFPIICLSCDVHLAQGRRFNARKRQVGEYLSTKIWAFECKCTCGKWFEIRTDPEKARYAVTEGARRQIQEWDPGENGGFPVFDTESKADGEEKGEEEEEGKDAFAKLEKDQKEKSKAAQRQARVEELEHHSRATWSDPYTLNSKLRDTFRQEKRKRTEQLEKDIELRDRIGWHQNTPLADVSSPSSSARDGEMWKAQRPIASKNKMKGKKAPSTVAQRLQANLLANSRRKMDPFLNQISQNSSASATFANGSRKKIVRPKARLGSSSKHASAQEK
ncbi:related to YJU2 - essential protein required for pre-mRNA splicing [Ustilago trichophora]|uniref:Related to YJU2 - essential protein required for pre-mRNA splicing n=1 Tax=Ustilago trichophora TaxID=86804 RepID=A0A5C3EGH3_9BASI|nr:related to YJU2 - essential protein required for pre-mRNA splicing [Ustilago trichophora]